MRIPTATYRLQLNRLFTLSNALDIVPYLHDLGISDLYLSPIFQAAEGSLHGYDIVDFTKLNTEIGQERDLQLLAEALQMLDMGLIVDIVPNHMNITSPSNKWWQSILLLGERSPYADYFDIDWDSPLKELKGKVLQPFLDKPLQEALACKQFALIEENGQRFVAFDKKQYPLSGDEKDLLKALKEQAYLLDEWKRSFTDLNYRRFFEIAELVCLKQENESVFTDTHKKLFEWVDRGWITGLRIDHIDGLKKPRKYLWELRKKYPDLFIICEKILHPQEALREDFPIQGTTGYDALNRINALFIKEDLQEEYFRFIKKEVSWQNTVLESKRYFLEHTMQSELFRLKRLIPQKLHSAVFVFLLLFPIYRSYAEQTALSKEDKELLLKAVETAAAFSPKEPWEEFTKELLSNHSFLLSLQQVTAPLAAKGVEDTAFYRYFPLASLNEVGGPFPIENKDIETFHSWAISRQMTWPNSLSTLTTHDTKRSEDVRARLNALSEMAIKWASFLQKAHELNAPFKTEGFPDRNEEYHLYQILLGTWDLKGIGSTYRDKIASYMVKAAKEAKLYTSWVAPNKAYEKALTDFVLQILAPAHSFIGVLEDFVKEISFASYSNTLSQTLLKMTIPGIPDFYQGSERQLYTLVDPGNRQLVEYSILEKTMDFDQKQKLIAKTLSFRRQNAHLFQQGNYIPIKSLGVQAARAIAFYRKTKEKTILVAIGRYFNHLFWEDTCILVEPGEYRNIFTEEVLSLKEKVAVQELFKPASYCLLEKLS